MVKKVVNIYNRQNYLQHETLIYLVCQERSGIYYALILNCLKCTFKGSFLVMADFEE